MLWARWEREARSSRGRREEEKGGGKLKKEGEVQTKSCVQLVALCLVLRVPNDFTLAEELLECDLGNRTCIVDLQHGTYPSVSCVGWEDRGLLSTYEAPRTDTSHPAHLLPAVVVGRPQQTEICFTETLALHLADLAPGRLIKTEVAHLATHNNERSVLETS